MAHTLNVRKKKKLGKTKLGDYLNAIILGRASSCLNGYIHKHGVVSYVQTCCANVFSTDQ